MEREPKPDHGGGPPLILVVDDVADNRELYAEYLEFAGYRVAMANDGHEALAKAFELHPDAVLMDLSLPGIDGWEVTRRLRQQDATKDITIIGLSGHTMYATEAKLSGCDAFMSKPALPETVADEIRRALGKTKTSFKLP
jgi:two-component system cell cycle response regulator DivK